MLVSEFVFTNFAMILKHPWYPIYAIIFYFMAAWFFLLTIDYFKINTIWGLFLAGAYYGWILEGIFRQTMYSNFPFYISWLGLGWHALISVLFVYYFFRKSMIELNRKNIVIFSISIGVLWGVFQAGWAQVTSIIESATIFFAYSLAITLIFMLAVFGAAYFYTDEFKPGIKELSLFSIILIIIYFFDVVYYLAALILIPILYFLNYYALNRHRKAHVEENSYLKLLNDQETIENYSISTQILLNYLTLLLIPVIASVTYLLFINLKITTSLFGGIFVVLTFAGFLMYIVSYFKVLRNAPIIEDENILPKESAKTRKQKNKK